MSVESVEELQDRAASQANVPDPVEAFRARITSSEFGAISRITSRVLTELQEYALDRGFLQILPVMISPFTDPLNHAVYPASIKYEHRTLQLTASMIFHKQLALNLGGVNGIFIVSPNIRLEKSEIKNSENHLIEFSQFDLEIKNADMKDVIDFVDGMVRSTINNIRNKCAEELNSVGRSLPSFDEPFPIFSSEQLREQYGDDFESVISQKCNTPCFVTNFKREFYDRESPDRRGIYNNFDLIYPEGYGEGLSGAEREFEFEQICYRMRELDMDLEPFREYLKAAERGIIPRTAGAGLGIQRFVKFIAGVRSIRDVCLFDRSISSDFLF